VPPLEAGAQEGKAVAVAAITPENGIVRRARQLDPFLVPDDSSCPSTLATGLPQCGRARLQWHLTADQLAKLAANSPTMDGRLSQAGVGPVIRCSSFLTDKNSGHRWPLGPRVALNMCPLPLIHMPPAWDGQKRKDRNLDEPLFLPAPLLRLGLNELLVDSSELEQQSALVVQMLLPRTLASIKDSVMARALPLHAASNALWRQPASDVLGDLDDEVTASAIRLSLQCPLTRARLVSPVRTDSCGHVECFDLNAFLECQQGARIAKWLCPICSASAQPEGLRLCSWTMDVLEKLPPTMRECMVEPDGTILAENTQDQTPSRKRSSSHALQAGDDSDNPICLDDD